MLNENKMLDQGAILSSDSLAALGVEVGWGGFSTQIETSYFQFWRLRGGKGSRKHRVRKSSIVLCDLWAGVRMFSEAQ